MASPEFLVLDVGHGNCAVLRDRGAANIFDAPTGTVLSDTLQQLGVTRIKNIFISHADEDHLGGVIHLLCNSKVKVERIFINPDAVKRTETWRDLRIALSKNRADVRLQLTTGIAPDLGINDSRIEVLAPTPAVAMGGVGAKDLKGRTLKSNSMSVVMKLVHRDHPIALLTGDIDEIGLDNLMSTRPDLRSHILIFPHHGGLPGAGNIAKFVKTLVTAVRAEITLFSIGRGIHGTPRIEVMQNLRASSPSGTIGCTQLSAHCTAEPPSAYSNHFEDLPARGMPDRTCCTGSIRLTLSGKSSSLRTFFGKHRRFIKKEVADPLCMRRWKTRRRKSL